RSRSPAASRAARAPAKASPAAVVSTTSTSNAGRRPSEPPRSAQAAPAAPKVTTATRARAVRRRAAPTGSAVTAPASSPSSSAASCSFTSRWVTSASRSGGSACAGARFRSTAAPARRAARAAASTATRGTSSWSMTTAADARSRAATSSTLTSPFAPGETTMEFCPRSSTWMNATPVGRSPRSTRETSTPSRRSAATSARPWSSSPTRPARLTWAPSRAAATAWFAPLPPGWLACPCPRTVSPGRGCRATLTTRSMLKLPTTTTRPRRSSGAGDAAPSPAPPPGPTSALPAVGVAPDDEAGGVARRLVGHVTLDDPQRLEAVGELEGERGVVELAARHGGHVVGHAHAVAVRPVAGQGPARDDAAQVQPPRQVLPRPVEQRPDALAAVVGVDADVGAVVPVALRVVVRVRAPGDGLEERVVRVVEVEAREEPRAEAHDGLATQQAAVGGTVGDG